MGKDPSGFDEERQALARTLRWKRAQVSVYRLFVLGIFLFLLVTGWSSALRDWAESNPYSWLAPTLYLAVLFLLGTLLTAPFSYLGGYRLEREFNLSTQSFRSWVLDRIKGLALGLAAVVAAGNVLLWLLASQPVWWWALAWALGIVVSLILGFLAPIVIAPLFFRFRPLQDAALRARFEALAAKAGVPVIGVFEMAASAKTRRSNAMVVGFGRTRRVVVTDTLLHDFTPEETESVLAHELGHQHAHDLVQGVGVGAAFSLVMWSFAGWTYATTGAFFRFSLADMAGLPLLLFWSGLVSTALGPLELVYSRHRESRADRFALEVTRNSAAFESAMVKIHDRNLGFAYPKPVEKWLFYSHPPAEERVEMARAFTKPDRAPSP